MESPINFPEIDKLINGEKYSLREANEVMMEMCGRNIGFVKLDSNEYQYGDYFITIGKWWSFSSHLVNIKDFSKWHLTSMPIFVAESKAKVIDSMMIVKVPGASESFPMPCNDNLTFAGEPVKGVKIDAIPVTSRQRLFDEMDFVMSQDWINMATMERKFFFGTLFYISSKQTLLLSDWSKVWICEADEVKAEARKNLRLWLKL